MSQVQLCSGGRTNRTNCDVGVRYLPQGWKGRVVRVRSARVSPAHLHRSDAPSTQTRETEMQSQKVKQGICFVLLIIAIANVGPSAKQIIQFSRQFDTLSLY
jgi:hypothetical protein